MALKAHSVLPASARMKRSCHQLMSNLDYLLGKYLVNFPGDPVDDSSLSEFLDIVAPLGNERVSESELSVGEHHRLLVSLRSVKGLRETYEATVKKLNQHYGRMLQERLLMLQLQAIPTRITAQDIKESFGKGLRQEIHGLQMEILRRFYN
ncbi:MAG: hypothetical protein SGCHY_000592 [Lobulomycetales sp.]